MDYEQSKVIGTASGFRVFDGGDLRSRAGRGQLAMKYEQFRQFRIANEGLFELMNDTVEVRTVGARTLEFQLPLRNPSRDRRVPTGATQGQIRTDHFASAWMTKQLIVDHQKMISRALDPLELQSYPGYGAVTMDDGSRGITLSSSVYANWKMTDIYAENIYKAAKILDGAHYISKKYHTYKIYIPTESDADFSSYRNHIWDPLTRLRNMMMQIFGLAIFGRIQNNLHFVGGIDFTRYLIKATASLASDATIRKIENYTIDKVGGITINQHLFIGNKFEAYTPFGATSPFYPKVGSEPQFIDEDEAFDFTSFDGLMVFKGSIGTAFGAPYRYEKINPSDGQLIMSNSFYAPVNSANIPSGALPGYAPAIELYDMSSVAVKAFPRKVGTPATRKPRNALTGTDILEQITNWDIDVPTDSATFDPSANVAAVLQAIQSMPHNTHIDITMWNPVTFSSANLTDGYKEFTITAQQGATSKSATDPSDKIRIRKVPTSS